MGVRERNISSIAFWKNPGIEAQSRVLGIASTLERLFANIFDRPHVRKKNHRSLRSFSTALSALNCRNKIEGSLKLTGPSENTSPLCTLVDNEETFAHMTLNASASGLPCMRVCMHFHRWPSCHPSVRLQRRLSLSLVIPIATKPCWEMNPETRHCPGSPHVAFLHSGKSYGFAIACGDNIVQRNSVSVVCA